MSSVPREPSAPACAHCGLGVPADRVATEGLSFCCDGCATVYSALAAHGLGRWYELRERTSAEAPRPARTTGRDFAELDDPAFLAAHARALQGGDLEADLYLEGVHCAACVWLVEKLPEIVPGVRSARLDAARSRARIAWDPRAASLARVARTLDSLGYTPHPWRGAEKDAARTREDRVLLRRLAVAGAAAMNAMMMAAALYANTQGDMAPELVQLLRWASLAVSVPATLWAAQPFFKGAWGSLRALVLHVDLPLSLAIGAAFVVSVVNTVRGAGEIFFDSLCALIFLLLVGRWLQARATRAAENAAGLLAALAPSSARVVEGEAVREVAVESLVAGQLVEVRAGESVPVDGTIVEGRSALDVSLLSGESRPHPAAPGDRVHAGTVNLAARVVVRADETGERTRLGRLVALMEEAAARRAPVLRLVDRLSGAFVFGVLVLAAMTLAFWWSAGPLDAMQHALALLLVTCPCVLAFATPLAVNAALGRAARRGILVKGGDALERLARPGLVLLDKTGTITEGRLALVGWEGRDDAKPLVGALEAQSSHPLALALAAALPADPALGVSDVEQVTGAGIRGRAGGRLVAAGSRALFAGTPLPRWATDVAERAAGEGLTPVLVALDGEVVAVASLGDRVRPEAREVVAGLQRRGWRVAVLSGDEPAVVRAVARRVGIAETDARGGMTPEQKLEHVREAMRATQPVVMVGDGVNDAAALAASHVGLAVHGGAEASLAAADAFTTRPGLVPVTELLDGGRSLSRLLRVNATLSIAYNVVGATLAMAGLMHPLVAALLMPASSISVTLISLKWPTFAEPE